MSDAVRPFEIAFEDAALEDLALRLQLTRWPEVEPVNDWSQGVPLSWLKQVHAHWRDGYDWRARETLLNRFQHFRTTLDELEIHFIHQRSRHPEAIPLLITHGWPGSIVEFHKVIEPLVDPVRFGGAAADAFHVVCPSLPGYGLSGKPAVTGWGVERIAQTWAALMQRLGHTRYLAQGGDWGSAVTQCIGWQDAAHCAGIHVTLAMSTRPQVSDPPTAAEQRALDGLKYYRAWDAGYSKEQSTRPQTVGYALTDSPLGQAAWILEKFWAWTDCDGDPLNVLTLDEMLDNVMLYWWPATGASSARLYWESFQSPPMMDVSVPVGASIFPKEIFKSSRRWCEARFPKLAYHNVLDKGGHFAAFEQPELFVQEVRAAFKAIRAA